MLSDSSRLRLSPACAYQQVEGRVVAVQCRRRTIHDLNETASLLWPLLEEGASFGDLQERLKESFDASPDIAREDLDAWVKEMEAAGLVEVS